MNDAQHEEWKIACDISHGRLLRVEKVRERHNISPFGASGFLVGSRLVDKGTRRENLQTAIAYSILRRIVKKEVQSGRR